MYKSEDDRLSDALDGWANRYADLKLKLDTAEAIALTMANKLTAIEDAIKAFTDAGDFYAIEAILNA